MRTDAAGWVLLEAILLTFIVLAAAAAIAVTTRCSSRGLRSVCPTSR